MDSLKTIKDFPLVEDSLVCVTDKKRKIKYWSKNGKKITGYVEEDVIDKSIDILFPDSEIAQELPKKLLESSIKQGRVTNLGWRKTKEGKLFWSKWIVKPIKEDGQTLAYTNIIRNLSEQKKKNRVLKNSLKLAKVAAWNIDLSNTVARLNLMEGAVELLKLENNPTTITFKKAISFVHPDYRIKLLRGILMLMREGKSLELEFKLIIKSSFKWCYLKAESEFFNNKCINIYGSIQNVHKEKANQILLKESEHKYKSSFNDSAVGMALVGLDGEWLKVNQSLCNIVGYSTEELLSITFQDITHHDDLQNDLDHLTQLEAGKINNYQIEKRYFHKEGHVVPVLLSVSKHDSLDGITQYYFSQIIDLSEIKQAKAEVAEKVKLLERKNNDLQRFAYVSAHHFSEPLNTIEAYSNVINKKLENDGSSTQLKTHFTYIKNSINRLKALLKGLLRIYNLEKKNSKIQTIIPKQSFNAVVNDLQREISNKEVKFNVDCKIESIEGFRLEFSVILYNLINNALKFSDDKVEISFNGRERDNDWIFTIEDNGSGIEENLIDKAFLLYEKLDSKDSDSLGMGLTLSKKLVELHLGKIWIPPQSQKGTKVHFTISKSLSNNGTAKSHIN